MEGSHPAAPAEPGTLKTSLVATPGLALGGGRGCGAGMSGGWAGSLGCVAPALAKGTA